MKVLKEILFGQQKQSDDLNSTVTRMIYNALAEKGYNVKGDFTDDYVGVAASVESYINDVVAGKHPVDDIFELIVGRKSVEVVKQGAPCVVTKQSVSDESTKIKFRVISIDDSITGENKLEEVATTTVKSSIPEFVPDDSRYYYTMAEKLKNKILPTVPEKAKEELAGNDYAIALSCVMHYFDIKENI